MSPGEEDRLILREFRRRNGRGLCQLLADLRRRLTRRSGWAPPLWQIARRAERLGLEVRWSGPR